MRLPQHVQTISRSAAGLLASYARHTHTHIRAQEEVVLALTARCREELSEAGAAHHSEVLALQQQSAALETELRQSAHDADTRHHAEARGQRCAVLSVL